MLFKKGLMVFICIVIMSCSTWKGMSTAEKIDATVAYYQSFSRGLTIATQLAVQVKPELEPAITVAMNAVRVLDRAVNMLALLNDTDEIQAQLKVVDGAAQAANASVAAVVEKDHLQSFFGGSTRTALAIRPCDAVTKFGIQCPGLLDLCG